MPTLPPGGSASTETDTLGLSLAEGKAILSSAQQYFVPEQCRRIAWSHSCCEKCGILLGRKGYHIDRFAPCSVAWWCAALDFGIVDARAKKPGASFSPLLGLVPAAVTPELEYLQVSGPRTGRTPMDETYVKVCGQWKYLYRAVDREGHTGVSKTRGGAG